MSQHLACLWAAEPCAVKPALGVGFLDSLVSSREWCWHRRHHQTQVLGLLTRSFSHSPPCKWGCWYGKRALPEELDTMCTSKTQVSSVIIRTDAPWDL